MQKLKIKTGVSISLFDGIELLPYLVYHLRPFIDFINVVFSEESFYGFRASDTYINEVYGLLIDLEERGQIDSITLHKTGDSKNRLIEETNKRNSGLKTCLDFGVNLYWSSDIDEFYDAVALKNTIEKIKVGRYTNTYVHILDYLDYNKINDSRNDEYYIPFLSFITSDSKHGINDNTPCIVDSTRNLVHTVPEKHFVLHNIFAHHLRLVRKNLRAKYDTKIQGYHSEINDSLQFFRINQNEKFISTNKFDYLKYL